ncbi:MAG: hypothetical protein JKY65_11540 [Planctomycetes bacterium]|nr:hypothetical protein [Planctomycetota bacterium]
MAQSSGISFLLSQHAEEGQPLLVSEEPIAREDGTPAYLTAWRFVPGQLPRPVDSEEALFLSRCLEAVADLAKKGKLGKAAARDGTRVLFYNLSELASGKIKTRMSYRRLDEVAVGHKPVAFTVQGGTGGAVAPGCHGRNRVSSSHMALKSLSVFRPFALRPSTSAGDSAWLVTTNMFQVRSSYRPTAAWVTCPVSMTRRAASARAASSANPQSSSSANRARRCSDSLPL